MKKSFELRKAIKENIFVKIICIMGILLSCYLGYIVIGIDGDIGTVKFFPVLLFILCAYLLITHGFRLKTEKNKHNELVILKKEKTREQLNDYLIEQAAEGVDDITLHKMAKKADEIIKDNDADKV